jgi:DeoR/GlpR family transcriptional regulator of sugar metabolism
MKNGREQKQVGTESGPNEAEGRRLSRDDRFARILVALRIGSSVRIADLAARFGVSTETVRRDLDELSRQGLVDRTYGGAAPAISIHEPAVHDRANERVAERRRIGACAAEMIEDGDVLMIDSGSTTVHFAQRLAIAAPRITVLTNCLGVALVLGPLTETRVVLCPGEYQVQEGGVFGPETAAFLQRFRATKAIIGASGLTTEGPVELDSAATWVKRTMIERAAQRFLLIDESKLDALSIETVCPLGQIDDLVTSALPAAALRDALIAAGTAVHVAGETAKNSQFSARSGQRG